MKTKKQTIDLLKLTKLLVIIALMGLGLKAKAQCHADYTVDTSSTSGVVIFTNTSTTGGSGTYCYMEFGDGQTGYFSGSTLTHTYLTGTYTACLILTDSVPACSDTVCYIFSVTNSGSPVGGCSAYFTTTDSAGYVFFNDLTSGSGLSYSWDYGDGSFGSTGGSNYHMYATPGTYTVCLSVSSFLGCSSTFCDTITVSNGTSGACLGVVNTNFTAADSAGYGVFTAGIPSGVSPVYHWDFGDGNTSSVAGSTDHLYTANGTYYVCLTVYETGGSYDSCQYCTYVNINSLVSCDASYGIVQDSLDSYSYFVYNNSTGSSAATYFWDFGDGNTSTLQYPTHTYSGTGPYYLCLTVTDGSPLLGSCTDTFCDSLAAGRSSTGITVTVVAPVSTGIAEQVTTTLLENYPNPFSGSTTINYTIAADAAVELNVVDLLGNEVAMLENSHKAAGSYSVSWNADGVTQGMYLLQMKANNSVTIKKIIVNK